MSESREPTSQSPVKASPHAQDVTTVVSAWHSHPEQGLTDAQVTGQRERHGWNELSVAPPEPAWRRFLGQFSDVVVWILLVAAIIAGLMGEWTDTAAICAIVLLNAMLGYYQEERAEQALASLQSLAAPTAKVIRAGKLTPVPARELVPGDLVEIEAGDHVPADLRLLNTFSVGIQESSLTGESEPVEKNAAVALPDTTLLADRKNMAYMGTVVASGLGWGLVVATGMHTEIGHIAGMLQSRHREPTPLQRRLAELGRILAFVSLALVGLILVLGLLRGRPLMEALLSSVSLAVAAVPEGLPAVVTIALALGLQRMVKRNALIRKLPSVETLGSVSVICSDKTGTLTRNEMTVRELIVGGVRYHLTGAGYFPQGEFAPVASPDKPLPRPVDDEDLLLALRVAAYCNHAQIQPNESKAAWEVIGDPTEGALVVMAMKGELPARESRPHVISELPFDSERKAMSVLMRDASGRRVQYTKGAPEQILDLCAFERRDHRVLPLTEERRSEIVRENADMANRALRVLGLACRDDTADKPSIDERDLTFVGLVGMIDPPRDEVKGSVERCRAAGIRPVMITGDHPATAMAIARELGLARPDDRVVTGADLERMSDQELESRVRHIAVYARVSPEHKLRIVRAWKNLGETVAMTGDGVNDAPAVKAADIGIAMGVTGTDVTREASSMVLMDDNFTSIVNAVEEGRQIYDNIRKFVIFLLSCNAGELLLMLVASLLGWPPPLLPVHLLWINLVTDGLPALALAMEPPEPGIMSRSPRPAHESIIVWRTGAIVVFQGALLAIVGLIAFTVFRGYEPEHVDRARTLTFGVVVFGELFRALASRSQVWTFWQLGPLTNQYIFGAVLVSALLQIAVMSVPTLQPVFETVSHSWREWGILALLALTPVTIIEITKLACQWFERTARA